MDKSETLILYFFIWLITFFTASLSQKVVNVRNSSIEREKSVIFNHFWYLITFIILWFFYVFSDISFDYYNYVNIFNTVQFSNILNGRMEGGFVALNLFIRIFTNNAYVAIGIIKTIILILNFNFIYTFRKDIDVGIAVLAYVSLVYFGSFNLISISLAASICVYSMKYLLQGKSKLSFIYLLLASTMHYTAIFLILIYIVYFIIKYKKIDKIRFYKIFILGIILVVIIIFYKYLGNYLINNISFFRKYKNYSYSNNTKLGFAQIIYYLPVFIQIYLAYYLCKNKRIVNFSIVWVMFGFTFGLLGYKFQVIDRMYVYFVVLFLITIPYYIMQLRMGNISNSIKFTKYRFGYNGTMLFWLVYYFSRFIIYLNINLENSGIDRYFFIWH